MQEEHISVIDKLQSNITKEKVELEQALEGRHLIERQQDTESIALLEARLRESQNQTYATEARAEEAEGHMWQMSEDVHLMTQQLRETFTLSEAQKIELKNNEVALGEMMVELSTTKAGLDFDESRLIESEGRVEELSQLKTELIDQLHRSKKSHESDKARLTKRIAHLENMAMSVKIELERTPGEKVFKTRKSWAGGKKERPPIPIQRSASLPMAKENGRYHRARGREEPLSLSVMRLEDWDSYSDMFQKADLDQDRRITGDEAAPLLRQHTEVPHLHSPDGYVMY